MTKPIFIQIWNILIYCNSFSNLLKALKTQEHIYEKIILQRSFWSLFSRPPPPTKLVPLLGILVVYETFVDHITDKKT